MRHFTSSKKLLPILFISGIALFILCGSMAIYRYPGGHRYESTSYGFSFLHNYWCELLRERTWNASENSSLPWARATMFIGAICSVLFWLWIPARFISQGRQRVLTQIAGIASMFCATLIMTPLHDEAILIGSVFGGVAVTVLLYRLYSSDRRRLFYTGIFVLALLIACNFLALTNNYGPLPVLQKVSFVIVMIWMLDLAFSPQLETKHQDQP